MADGEVKECLTSGDVFERDFVEVSDLGIHPAFPRSPPVSASLCLESAFRAILKRCRRFSKRISTSVPGLVVLGLLRTSG
jgi:hypothetical protein